MATDTSNTYDTINELIKTCHDGENGFETAANGVEDSALKAEFLEYSRQRRQFAADLRMLLSDAGIGDSGDEPATGGSVAAALHRGWINLKQAVTTNDRHAVLAECERGEDSAVETYREALNAGLPNPFADIVSAQYEQIQRAHDRVKALRDSAARH